MIVTVVVINVVISLVCLLVARKIWQIRIRLAKVTTTLQRIEHDTAQILYPAPQTIANGQIGTHNLHIRYQQLCAQWQRLRQIMVVLGGFQKLTELRGFRRSQSAQR
jgi:hypothetical protein